MVARFGIHLLTNRTPFTFNYSKKNIKGELIVHKCSNRRGSGALFFQRKVARNINYLENLTRKSEMTLVRLGTFTFNQSINEL